MAVSTNKFDISDPSATVNQADASQLSTLSNRGSGNSAILDSIKMQGEFYPALASKPDTRSQEEKDIDAEVARYTASINRSLDSIKKKEPTTTTVDGVTTAAPVDFSTLGAAKGEDGDKESIYKSLGKSLDKLGGTGDLLAVGKVKKSMDDKGFDSLETIAAVSPSLISTTLTTFNLDKLMPGLPEDLQAEYGAQFNSVLGEFTNDWYWLDKGNKIYNFKVLAGLSDWSLKYLSLNDDYSEIVRLARGLREYRIDRTEK